ncbi:OR8J2 protein, partial [Crocuta crocuta]
MAPGNLTQVTEFILTGVSDRPELQIPLFFVFLLIYGLTVAGNLGIITLTSVDAQLHTPMYFLLRHLAVINLGDSTVIAPEMLVNFLVSKKTISYYGCAAQLGGFLVFIVAETFMLAAMAYDRYVAICNPLLYMVVVSPQICLLLVSLTYLYSLTTALTVTSCVFSVSYCSSNVTEFILTGVSDRPELQIPLFFVFLLIYGLTVAGNLGIITLTSVDAQLHTPMYFLLRHLAVINLGDSTVIAPEMLVNFLVSKKTISYYGCAAQLGGFLVFIVAETFMLAAMAYDRYVAICNPLLYMVVVSPQICLLLVSLTYLYSLTTALTVTSCVFSVSYCSSNVINHFYCDNVPLLALSCSDTYIPETVVFSSAGINLLFSMVILLISYFNIVLAILRIRSSEGQRKAFSTCASHM